MKKIVLGLICLAITTIVVVCVLCNLGYVHKTTAETTGVYLALLTILLFHVVIRMDKNEFPKRYDF